MSSASDRKSYDMKLHVQLYNLHQYRKRWNSEFEPAIPSKAKAKEVAKAKEQTPLQKAKATPKEKKQNFSPQESKIFVTEILAIDPEDNAIKHFSGPHITASSEEEAHFLCQNTGLGYCRIIGELVGLIDTNGNDVKDAFKLN